VHHWQLWVKILESLLAEVALLTATALLPVGSIKEETIDISTFFRWILEITDIIGVLDVSLQDDLVKWKVLRTSSLLHNSRQERHRVK
jgi:hypothetical protein